MFWFCVIGMFICKLCITLPMEITSVSVARTQSESLRTTVPISIVRQFNLKDKDRLGWELKSENDEFYIKLKPFK